MRLESESVSASLSVSDQNTRSKVRTKQPSIFNHQIKRCLSLQYSLRSFTTFISRDAPHDHIQRPVRRPRLAKVELVAGAIVRGGVSVDAHAHHGLRVDDLVTSGAKRGSRDIIESKYQRVGVILRPSRANVPHRSRQQS